MEESSVTTTAGKKTREVSSLLRADAPSFVPFCKEHEASSSSSSSQPRINHQSAQQQRHHQANTHHRKNRHRHRQSNNDVRGNDPQQRKKEPPIGQHENVNKKNNERRRRARRISAEQKLQPAAQEAILSSSSPSPLVKNRRKSNHQQQAAARDRRPKKRNTHHNKAAQHHSNHHHYHPRSQRNDDDANAQQQQYHKMQTPKLPKEEKEEDQNKSSLFIIQNHEQSFPILLAATTPIFSSTLMKDHQPHQNQNHQNLHNNNNNLQADGAVWNNAKEVLGWTEQEQIIMDPEPLTNDSLNQPLTSVMTHGGSSSDLTLLSRRKPASKLPNNRSDEESSTTASLKTQNVIVSDKQGGGNVEAAEEEGTLLYRRKRQQAQQHQNWDMNKLRDRWWQLLRDRPVKQVPSSPLEHPPLPQNNDDSEDSSSSSEASFEDIYFGKPSATTTIAPLQQQEQQEEQEPKLDDSYYSSTLPLHEAIQRNDEAALRAILKSNGFLKKSNSSPNDSSSNDNNECQDKDDEACSSRVVMLSPLQLAVQLDRPRLVRILFAQSTYNDSSSSGGGGDLLGSSNIDSGSKKPAILMAAELGHEECLQAFLSASHGPAILLTRDVEGNTVLHYCCQTINATVSMLSLCLRAASGGSSYNSSSSNSSSSFLSKLLLYKNNRRQTCMHVACAQGRVDLVEVILSDTTGSLTLLSKVLAMQDCNHQTPLLAAVGSGSTDVVMALLMWRGNNVVSSTTRATGGMPIPSSSSSSCPCPLVLAVRTRNVDMVLLLLEFNDPNAGKKGYNLTRALCEAVRMTETTSKMSATPPPPPTRAGFVHNDCSNDGDSEHEFNYEDELIDIVRILINAGANPCLSMSPTDSVTTGSTEILPTGSSVLCVAAELGKPNMLTALLTSYQAHLDDIRKARRRDPMLQKQPESFFSGMESRENAERTISMRDALTSSLFSGWKNESSSINDKGFFECSLALYRAGAVLGWPGLERLKQTFPTSGRHAKCIKPMANVALASSMTKTLYEAKYSHFLGFSAGGTKSNKKMISRDKPVVIDANMEERQFWSRVMQKSPWKVIASTETCACDWIPLVEQESTKRDVEEYPRADIRLVSNDGHVFLVHSEIIAKKSDKLAAAIRFESMRSSIGLDDGDDDDDDLPEIEMSACSGRLCRWMLQHIYHGSIVDGLPESDPIECCHALLELMLVAGEYLCWSLLQECEMKLLSVDPHRCHCSLCSRTTASSSDKNEIECEYYTVGPSMCITPETVLDVLAVSQYMGQSLDDTSYTLRRSEESSLPSWLEAGVPLTASWMTSQPLEALREASICTILMHFQSVMESEAFRSQFVLNDSLDNQAGDAQSVEQQRARILLQNTMDELVDLVAASAQ